MNKNLIVKYCGNIEERIRSCRSRRVAKYLKKLLCLELHDHINNKAIETDLKLEIEHYIQTYFSKNGDNIFIQSRKDSLDYED